MAKEARVFAAAETTDNGLVAATEEAVVTLGPVNYRYSSARMIVLATAEVSMGATAGTVTARIRRGTTTGGTLIGEGNALDIPINGEESLALTVVDNRAASFGDPYVLTLESSQTATFLQGTLVGIET